MRLLFYASVFILCFCTLPGVAQVPANQQPPPPRNRDITIAPTNPDEAETQLERDMARKAAKERVAALKSDTDKLLKLSIELKQYVDKSDENVLSLDVIKKADEIERLARSIRDKMKGPN